MTHTYESNDDLTAVELSPLRELEEAGTALELTREDLDRARDHHARTVKRWTEACKTAHDWIEARDRHRFEDDEQKKAMYDVQKQQGMTQVDAQAWKGGLR